jgi:UDP-glucose 4-epimerase
VRFLVVGGGGYIGSHMAKMLHKSGSEVVIIDNLSTGMKIQYGTFIVGDLCDKSFLNEVFSGYKFDGVFHFAASSLVGESVCNPAKYYRNNVANTLNLLDVMIEHEVQNLIFSSTAAIFGNPVNLPINEDHPKNPVNPYGASKLMLERIISDYSSAYGLNAIFFRYFNACGADPEFELGENHNPETHLIPLLLQTASGRREEMSILGDDYATPDGTCIRDFIHVVDLCHAHQLGIEHLLNMNKSSVCIEYNLGSGSGYSVMEVVNAVRTVVAKDGASPNVFIGERRQGDPEVLVADSKKAKSELGWQPEYQDISIIITHAWEWEKKVVKSGL